LDRLPNRRLNSVAAGIKRLTRGVFAALLVNFGSDLTLRRRSGAETSFVSKDAGYQHIPEWMFIVYAE
jgi:hypothetical protein